MELLHVMSGQIWIHSEVKREKVKDILSNEELLKGIPNWEAGNASYLIEKKGAKVITPWLFESHLKPLLESHSNCR